MAQEYPALDISHDPELLKLAEEVRKTKKARTVKLTEGVIAVVKPERTGDRRQPGRRAHPDQARRQTPAKAYSLESAYGAVADAGGPRDFDQMIRQAKEERVDRLLKQL
jgi:hypothetical protein